MSKNDIIKHNASILFQNLDINMTLHDIILKNLNKKIS